MIKLLKEQIYKIVIAFLILIIILGISYFYFLPKYSSNICVKCYNQGTTDEIIYLNQNAVFPVINGNSTQNIKLIELCKNIK